MRRAASASIVTRSRGSIYDALVDGRTLAGLDRRDHRSTVSASSPRRSSSPARRSSSRRSSRGSAVWPSALADVARSLRLRPHRLPAVTWAPDRERADRGRRGPRPHPVRVLRPRRAQPADRNGQSRPREPQSRPRARGRRPDDVRRPHEPVRRCRGGGSQAPRRGVFDTVVPRSVRLSEAPSHGLPIARYAPARRAPRRTRSSRPSFGAAARRSVPSPRMHLRCRRPARPRPAPATTRWRRR